MKRIASENIDLPIPFLIDLLNQEVDDVKKLEFYPGYKDVNNKSLLDISRMPDRWEFWINANILKIGERQTRVKENMKVTESGTLDNAVWIDALVAPFVGGV